MRREDVSTSDELGGTVHDRRRSADHARHLSACRGVSALGLQRFSSRTAFVPWQYYGVDERYVCSGQVVDVATDISSAARAECLVIKTRSEAVDAFVQPRRTRRG